MNGTKLPDPERGMSSGFASTGRWQDFKAYAPVWLVLACLLLLPVGRATELPMLIMAIAGFVLIWRHRLTLFNDPGQRLLGVLFLCIWIPILASLTDAVNPEKSASTAILFPRHYLAGVFVVWTLQERRQRDWLLRLVALLVAFWVFDALIQAIRGVDLFGFRYVSSRLNGVYGEEHLDLGVALPTLAPFLLFALRRNHRLLAIATLLTSVVVLLAGSRGGWISFTLVCLLLLANAIRSQQLHWRTGAAFAALLIAVLAVFTQLNPDARHRFETTMGLFSGEFQAADTATSGRLVIWEAAARMIQAHPINGVGCNGFRHAYPDFALPDDPFVNPQSGIGSYFAHQLLLQVGTDTGLIGLAGLMLFYVAWLRSWKNADASVKAAALPFALAPLAWLFPLNTHSSFYSSQWSQLIWLLLALYCAALAGNRRNRIAARHIDR